MTFAIVLLSGLFFQLTKSMKKNHHHEYERTIRSMRYLFATMFIVFLMTLIYHFTDYFLYKQLESEIDIGNSVDVIKTICFNPDFEKFHPVQVFSKMCYFCLVQCNF